MGANHKYDSYLSKHDYQPSKDFIQKFKKKYNKEPELFAAMAYDAVKLISLAVNSCDDSACIKNFLYNISYEGASGNISFDSYGDVQKPMTFMTIKNQKFVKI